MTVATAIANARAIKTIVMTPDLRAPREIRGRAKPHRSRKLAVSKRLVCSALPASKIRCSDSCLASDTSAVADACRSHAACRRESGSSGSFKAVISGFTRQYALQFPGVRRFACPEASSDCSAIPDALSKPFPHCGNLTRVTTVGRKQISRDNRPRKESCPVAWNERVIAPVAVATG
jgi:hypothetical protein